MSVIFLENGDISSIFQPTGIFPRSRDSLKIRYSGSAIITCSSFSTLGAAPSGHGDLFGFILDSLFVTSPGVNFMSINSLSVLLVNVSAHILHHPVRSSVLLVGVVDGWWFCQRVVGLSLNFISYSLVIRHFLIGNIIGAAFLKTLIYCQWQRNATCGCQHLYVCNFIYCSNTTYMIHHTMSWLPRVNLQKINGKKELFEFANKKELHRAEFITIKINFITTYIF